MHNSCPTPASHASPSGRCALTKELACWLVIFYGRRATLKHLQGLNYIKHLLQHPNSPIHGSELFALFLPAKYRSAVLPEAPDPAAGVVECSPFISEVIRISGARDERERRAALRKAKRKFEQLCRSDETPAADKPDYEMKIREIEEFLTRPPCGVLDGSTKAVRAVRRSIARVLKELRKPVDRHRRPDPVLGDFADHLQRYLVIPSRRYCGSYAGGWVAREGIAGCLIYEPPPGVIWV